jgi:hypothetical protein
MQLRRLRDCDQQSDKREPEGKAAGWAVVKRPSNAEARDSDSVRFEEDRKLTPTGRIWPTAVSRLRGSL